MPRPVLAAHCKVCAKVATCTCRDCETARSAVPRPRYAQIVGGALVQVTEARYEFIEGGDW